MLIISVFIPCACARGKIIGLSILPLAQAHGIIMSDLEVWGQSELMCMIGIKVIVITITSAFEDFIHHAYQPYACTIDYWHYYAVHVPNKAEYTCTYRDNIVIPVYHPTLPVPLIIPGGKERICTHLIGGNMRFLHERARVLPHGTAQNRSFPVRSMTKSTWSCSDSARV